MYDSAYFDCFTRLRTELHNIAECLIRFEHLDSLGVPNGSLIFCKCRKSYKKKDGTVSKKEYVNSYLYINKRKYYVSQKRRKNMSVDAAGDVNDPNNKAGNIILQGRLAMRMMIDKKRKNHMENARLLWNLTNTYKPRGVFSVDFEDALSVEYEKLKSSDQYNLILADVDRELAITDKASLNTRESSRDPRAQRPDFSNEIFLNDYERLRSKNELIAAFCMHDAGLLYLLEPYYPGVSNQRADFKLIVDRDERKNVYIEIAGMLSDETYKDKLFLKRDLAVASGIPLVIIDMTDYPDENGRWQTRLYYKKLKKIFCDIQLGLLPCKGEIVRPY